MPFDPEKHHHRSQRLKGYDYTLSGAYFATICTYGRESLFGEIVDGIMHPNLFGQVVRSYWERIPLRASDVALDAFVVMLNHVHGIIVLTGNARCRGEALAGEVDDMPRPLPANASPPHGTVPGSLGAIVQSWKSLTSRRINHLRGSRGATLWQEGYYERIIRDENELNAIREYIAQNPVQWEMDSENPSRC